MKKILFSLLIIFSLFSAVSCSDKTNNATEPSKDNTNITDNVIENNEEIGFKQGNLAPDFEVELLTGEKVKLSDATISQMVNIHYRFVKTIDSERVLNCI